MGGPAIGLPVAQLRPGEIVVVGFAGGGGSSLGIKQALGRDPDVALNHDRWACAMHKANHPGSRVHCQDIWRAHPTEAVTYADPDGVVRRHKVGLAWFSPDCRHFSRAKGAPLVDRKVRDLAWVVVKWAEIERPRVIILENVVEYRKWGPLIEVAPGKFMPDKSREGVTFRLWEARLKRLGYRVEWQVRRAMNAGAPTIRERLYMVARCDGEPIVLPEPTHGAPESPAVIAGQLQPWRTAAEIIDWSIPCPSIFWTRKQAKKHGFDVRRPLAPATMKRVAKGIWRFVINDPDPFIVPITHTRDSRVHSIREGLRTQTCANRGEHALCMPFVTKFRQNSTGHRAGEPLHTVTANSYRKRGGCGAPLAIVMPVLAGCGGRAGQSPPKSAGTPINTQTAKPDQILVAPYLAKFQQNGLGRGARKPLDTVMAGAARFAVIATGLAHMGNGERKGQKPRTRGPKQPVSTIVSTGSPPGVLVTWLIQHNTDMVGHRAKTPVSTIVNLGSTQAIGAAHLMNMKGSTRRARSARQPLSAICAGGEHAAEVCALLIRYHANGGQWLDPRGPMTTGTTLPRVAVITVKGERLALSDVGIKGHKPRELLGVVVTIGGEDWLIVDVGMRMLTIRERFLAQGFPPDWIIDIEIDGKPASGKVLGRLVGNSVCPPEAYALVAANCNAAVAMEAAGD